MEIYCCSLYISFPKATEATTMKPAIKAHNLSVIGCGKNKYTDDLDKRILGGHEAKEGQWPWLVRMDLPRNRGMLEGELTKPQRVAA